MLRAAEPGSAPCCPRRAARPHRRRYSAPPAGSAARAVLGCGGLPQGTAPEGNLWLQYQHCACAASRFTKRALPAQFRGGGVAVPRNLYNKPEMAEEWGGVAVMRVAGWDEQVVGPRCMMVRRRTRCRRVSSGWWRRLGEGGRHGARWWLRDSGVPASCCRRTPG